mgnify:CR=1 FL=1
MKKLFLSILVICSLLGGNVYSNDIYSEEKRKKSEIKLNCKINTIMKFAHQDGLQASAYDTSDLPKLIKDPKLPGFIIETNLNSRPVWINRVGTKADDNWKEELSIIRFEKANKKDFVVIRKYNIDYTEKGTEGEDYSFSLDTSIHSHKNDYIDKNSVSINILEAVDEEKDYYLKKNNYFSPTSKSFGGCNKINPENFDFATQRRGTIFKKNDNSFQIFYKGEYLGVYPTYEEAEEGLKLYFEDPEKYEKPELRPKFNQIRDENGTLTRRECTICKQIVHMLCAVTNPNSDAWTCKECHDDSKTETYHGSDAGSDKDTSIIQNMTVTVDNIMNEEFTTITDSVKDKAVKLIAKDYFVTKRQRVNNEMKEMDPDWEDLRTKVNKMIDSALKEEMVVEAQRINLKYAEKDQMVMVQNFRGIGKSWKMDGSVSNAKKINQVAYGVFGSKKSRPVSFCPSNRGK